MVEKVFLCPLTPYAFRRYDSHPLVTGVCQVTNGKYQNLCVEVTYDDGFVNYVPLGDIWAGAYRFYVKENYNG